MSNPLFRDAIGNPVYLEGMYAGGAAFLCVSGPSLLTYNLAQLRLPGIVSMGINNSPAAHAKECGDALNAWRPQLWVMTDDVASFVQSIYLDPKIIKLLPEGKSEHKLFDSDKWAFTETRVKDCPGVFYYRRNNWFQASQYLTEPTVNWGNHEDRCHCGWQRPGKAKGTKRVKVCEQCKANFNTMGGGRSVMLAAIRILYALGIRTLFIVGWDMKMAEGQQNYACEQERHTGSINSNTKTYGLLNLRFDQLKPHFAKAGFKVYNCLETSGLRSFPFVPFNEAVDFALKGFPDVTKERTTGLYDRKRNEKLAKEAAAKLGAGDRVGFAELLARVKRA